jgi:Uri superfamily endonuclease
MTEELNLRKENKGSYVLVLFMQKPSWIKAGKLPKREFRPGIYLYIGRAKKHLRGRLARHLRSEKKFFWHIDYLLREARIKEIWYQLDFFNECHIASEIIEACGEDCSPILGFGASDCQCPSHLIYYNGEHSFLSSLRNKSTLNEVKIHDIKHIQF